MGQLADAIRSIPLFFQRGFRRLPTGDRPTRSTHFVARILSRGSHMKIMLSGLHADFDVDTLKERLNHFGPVTGVQVITEGDPDKPWVLVELAVDAARATEVARRIDGIYFRDRFLRALVMHHE
jgi:hypothetical protein